MTRHPTYDRQLHALADGQLDAKAAERLAETLKNDPDAAEDVARWQAQNDALRASVPEPSAQDLSRLMARAQVGRRSSWSMAQMAAMLAMLAVGIGGGYAAARIEANSEIAALRQTTQEAVALAAAAHRLYSVEVTHPVEVRADTDREHLFGWLTKRMGVTVMAPDMAQQGYALLGGRILPHGDAPAAQYMYETAEGARVTLYILRTDAAADTPLRYSQEDGLTAVSWQDGPLRYVLVGPMGRDQLEPLAIALHDELI